LDLEPGLYEELVTRRLRERIDELIAEGRRIREGRVDPARNRMCWPATSGGPSGAS
jgi:hypothetical protein